MFQQYPLKPLIRIIENKHFNTITVTNVGEFGADLFTLTENPNQYKCKSSKVFIARSKNHTPTSESMTKRQKEHVSVRFRVSPTPILHMTHNNRGARTFQHTVPQVFLFSWEFLTFSPLHKTMQKTTFMAIHFTTILTLKLKDGFAKTTCTSLRGIQKILSLY